MISGWIIVVCEPPAPVMADPTAPTQSSIPPRSTATFSAPDEYVVRAQVNDTSGDGGGGEQCCWTTALVRVTVK